MEDQPKKQTLLIVDDTVENIDVLKSMLENEYRIKIALNGKKALEIATKQEQPDLILLDVMMPEIDGYEVCKRLKANPLTKKIPVIFVTALSDVIDESKGFEAGGVDYITKPVNPLIVNSRVRTHLALYDQNRVLEDMVRKRTKELNDTRIEIIKRLGLAAEYKDNETGMHVIRMSKYSHIIALEIGFSTEEAEMILIASPMHDIGKIGIPDRILLKPGKLDDDEWKIMVTHCQIGYKIIGEHYSELLKASAISALTHHEKWNGTGYPRRTKGEDIPLIGRIVAVADVFDALTSERPYKKEWPIEKAIELIKQESGKHFDPNIVPAFIKRLPEIIEVKKNFAG